MKSPSEDKPLLFDDEDDRLDEAPADPKPSLRERLGLLRAKACGALSSRFAGFRLSHRLRRVLWGLLLLLALSGLVWKAVVKVPGGYVGVVVNNLSGETWVEERVGYRVLIPWVFSFHLLDRQVQTLVMSDIGGAGFEGGDAVKVKTLDGSNVSIDLQVTYRMLPEQAAEILRDAGRGHAFGALWVRSSVRAAALAEFGKLTTEQIYDAATQTERSQAIVLGLNETLTPRGIEIVSVAALDLRFYQEYEELIRKKKLADQEVEEQQAQLRLAVEAQRKEVADASFARDRAIAEAHGAAQATLRGASGEAVRTRVDAESQLITDQRNAEGTLVKGLAEAEGLRQSAEALGGRGGVNLVALEYAKQLAKINFAGVPVLDANRIEQYRLHPGASGVNP